MSERQVTRLHQLIDASLHHANAEWKRDQQTPEHYVLLAMTHFAMLIIEEAIEIAELKEQDSGQFDRDISVGHYIRNYFTQVVEVGDVDAAAN